MELDGCIIACICEGGTEEVITKILLENNKLKFNYDDLLDEDIIKERSAKKIETKHLNKSFDKKIIVIRIVDSKKERFRISKPYQKKIKEVINVITAPEIEMLIIINEGKYNDYKRKHSSEKPSDYCKSQLGMSDVKKISFIEDYFSDCNKLISAILEYKRVTRNDKNIKISADLLA